MATEIHKPFCRDRAVTPHAANSGLVGRLPGKVSECETVWWAREDSNLQPDRYERTH